MSDFGLSIPQYNGPQYYEVQELMKKEHPELYNNLLKQRVRGLS